MNRHVTSRPVPEPKEVSARPIVLTSFRIQIYTRLTGSDKAMAKRDLEAAKVTDAFVAQGKYGDCVESIRRAKQEGDVFHTMQTIMQKFLNDSAIRKDVCLLHHLRDALCLSLRYAEALFASWDKSCKLWTSFPGRMRLDQRFDFWRVIKATKKCI